LQKNIRSPTVFETLGREAKTRQAFQGRGMVV
jgi:hypothetical protein